MNERLKELRKERGVLQKDVAQAIGVTIGAYCNYENGLREPSVDIIIKLCKYFGVTSDYLIGLSEF